MEIQAKKRKNEYAWLQEIDHDPREERSRKEKTHDDLVKFTRLMQSKLTSKLKDPCDVPAIFPLLCKLYLPDEKPRAESSPSKCKDVFIRQTSLERERTVEITALAKSLVSKPAVNTVRKLPQEPNNPRDWVRKKKQENPICWLQENNITKSSCNIKGSRYQRSSIS